MRRPLPKSGFHWKRATPTEEQIMKVGPNARKGWILEVDLEYPEELHEAHNGAREKGDGFAEDVRIPA